MVPQTITHDKVLVNCDAEFNEFITTMDLLGEKLGPILFQFGVFNEAAFRKVDDFLARLKPFLKKLPRDHKFAIEIRNKDWLVPQFVETLREHRVALALIDLSVVAMRAAKWFDRFDPITADFTYVRWLGDRKAIEEQTKVWDRIVVDRGRELNEWADVLSKLKIPIYTYTNNHYNGYGPATVEMFRNLWRQRGGNADSQIKVEQRPAKGEQARLFT